MIQFGRLRREVADNIAQAGAPGQLSQAQGHELQPTRHLAQFLTLVVAIGEGLEFMSRNKF